ncbi:carboxylesterase/lipase family protein [Ketobacter sp.]|uniref:carboxylesterase/lipase family protein n=1 Tax=Ketobacter sp. TaxID=2083498 RepID=UPI000F1104A2|nr:carboxylesterase/lipase family protein [Ketobacter sp.]RLT94784.1 MAG: carboxylesterase family protein [Ketobacter sp.]
MERRIWPALQRWFGVVALTSACVLASGCHDELHVKVKSGGWVTGKWHDGEAGGARAFLGIPYAQPPVGELRFQPPKPAARWHGDLDATAFGPSCMQNPGALSASGELSEDCLTLNVYSPQDPRHGSLPVMVFIHGGAFVAGGSNQYDGWRLAQEYGVVVVTLNYRLGALGFLSHPELDQEMGVPQSGNMALKDQQLALQWVQQNIAAFGGDPKQVTLFGESAGSMSTCVHMVAPGSQNLAAQFIMESAVCVGGLPVNTRQQSDSVSEALLQTFCGEGVDRLSCLRQVPAEALVAWGADAGIFGAGWSPTVVPDSNILPAQPVQLIASGQYNPGPILVGTNRNEWGLFQLIGAAPSVSTIDEFNQYIAATYPPPLVTPLQALYAPASDDLANSKLVELMTDQVFRCPTRNLARLTQAMGSSVWLYSFDLPPAFHAMELPYVFGNPSATLAPVLIEPVRAAVQGYWSQFAFAGDPNREGLVAWPPYDGASDLSISLQLASTVETGLAATTCDFWDSLIP